MSIFHRHKWTDWVVTDRGVTVYVHQAVGWYTVQERYCAGCGKTEVSDQSYYGGQGAHWCYRRSEMGKRTPRKDGVHA